MSLRHFSKRCEGFYQRRAASYFSRRPFSLRSECAYISFTFDDFPRSALLAGGAILQKAGLTGTYYAALGLMGQCAPTGEMFLEQDLTSLLQAGNELGCHTFAHCHSWNTDTTVFERSIMDNRSALARLIPGAEFKTFAYPISVPRPQTKARMGALYACSRGGGQQLNAGSADLNNLSAYFLEMDRGDPKPMRATIDRNREKRGWLVFATHDIAERPTPYGCTPEYFAEVVECAVASGARILPVATVLEELGAIRCDKETLAATAEAPNSYFTLNWTTGADGSVTPDPE